MNDQTETNKSTVIEERRARLLAKPVSPPTRANTVVLLPLHDGRIHYACVRGLMQIIPRISGILDQSFSSLIPLTRNKLINGFLRTGCEWAVMIDSDIEFDLNDFTRLMQYERMDVNVVLDLAVNAPYARKDDSEKIIDRGLGFSCVHRHVLEMIQEELAVPFQHEGIPMHDFFIVGGTSTGGYLGEDAGFWWLCSQVGVVPRLETRCNLKHWGTFAYRTPVVNFVTGDETLTPF